MLGLRDDLGVVLASGEQLDGTSRRRLDSRGVFLHKPFSLDALYEAVAGVTKD
ncbi:MAG: hypothetical protein VX466_12660 [Myxococcota bacterium]|nr:hypothetical protein [Myxococcota bacterium]